MRAALPGRLPQLLHLAFPLALQFAVMGWWRSAAWSFAIAAFGSWGLADRWIASDDHAHSSWHGLIRAVRATAGTLASLLPAALFLEMFLRLLGAPPNH